MKIAFFEIEPEERQVLEKTFINDELFFFEEHISEEHLPKIAECEVLSVFIYSALTEDILAKLPSLKLIVTRSTGTDHIDTAFAEERGITVCNVDNYGISTVAEHTFALILALSRKVHESHLRRIRNNFSIDGLVGFDLQGKALGVIGTGKIGKNVIRIARGFDMAVKAYDLFPDTAFAAEYNVEYCSLAEILSTTDIISLHVPYSEENHHIINTQNIQTIKPGAIIINTARGALVQNEALLWALEHQVLGGAGLDVLEGEHLIREEKELIISNSLSASKMSELIQDHMLLSYDEVVYTPHIAFYSKEALERILMTTIEHIQKYQEDTRVTK